jgi:DNA-binding LytR/AlgR family response regulator
MTMDTETRRPTALIADDEAALARHLQLQLARTWPALQIVGQARHGHEAAQAIAQLQPDIAFLDIRMPGLSGLEVAQGIEGATRVVFVTAFEEFAVQAFEQAAVDYLLKPVTEARLQRTVARLQAGHATEPGAGHLAQAMRRLQAPPGERLRWIRASSGDSTVHIAVDDVQLFEADEKYTVVHCGGQQHLIRLPIAELVTRLDPDQFWQVHRATLINLNHLQRCRRDDNSRLWLQMRGMVREWPVARAYVHLFKAM